MLPKKQAPLRVWDTPELSLYFLDRSVPFRPDSQTHATLLEDAFCQEEYLVTGQPGEILPLQLIVSAKEDMTLTSARIKDCPWELRVPVLFGNDRHGKAFQKELALGKDYPWPVWLLLSLPLNFTGAKSLEIALTFRLADHTEKTITLPVLLTAQGPVLYQGGEDEKFSLSRLHWLDSTLGVSSEFVPKPFEPLSLKERTLSLLGRRIVLGEHGFPQEMITYFTSINQRLAHQGKNILAAPITLQAIKQGAPLHFTYDFSFDTIGPQRISWTSKGTSSVCQVTVQGAVEFDGWMEYTVHWESSEQTTLEDIAIVIPLAPEFATYFMGVDTMAIEFPKEHHWQWNPDKHQDGCYAGSINGGLVVRPLSEDYSRPFCNIYYGLGKKNLPTHWVNQGKGSFVGEKRENVHQMAYHTGALTLSSENPVETSLDIGFTPFKKTDPAAHYATKYYHNSRETAALWLKEAKDSGTTHINVHHANQLNPFINYPMYESEDLGEFIRNAHSIDMKVKPYYTIRELTSHLPEFYPLLSLGEEIFPSAVEKDFGGVPGQGGKEDSLQTEAGHSVTPAWKSQLHHGKYQGVVDASVLTHPDSRLVNFYIEGLRWMCENLEIDGIYIDDTGFDRKDMQRIRYVFEHYREGLIDFHSWNHFGNHYGESWGHNSVMYAEIFPYVDSLWFGEGFDYNELNPTEILVETSGLPFGLMGEMLQGGGNLWRGLLVGNTTRTAYSRHSPQGVWHLRETYDLASAEIIGYWDNAATITAQHPEVMVTEYRQEEFSIVCAASFAPDTIETTFDFSATPYTTGEVLAIEHMQEGQGTVALDTPFTIPPQEGVVLLVAKG